jgi:dethiobiotin synthetase
MKDLVITGIGTEIGKSFIAAILTEALEADYWKPVQAGNLDCTDTDFIKQGISNTNSYFHQEIYRLSMPLSPHAAAKAAAVVIDLHRLKVPNSRNRIIIELAGGIMTPLNNKQLNIHLLEEWALPVVLVSKHYLGSINHTLLSAKILEDYKIKVVGIIFNGEPNPSTEEIILAYTGLNCIAKINQENYVNRETVKRYANELKDKMKYL